MKTYLIVLLGLCPFFFFGQEEVSPPSFFSDDIPVAPSAAALAKYAFEPVNLSTGQPSIAIPLWNVKGRDLSLPIQLSYRPGVKIEETSPYTGHGWSLLAGGIITRQIKGEIDPVPRYRIGTDYITHEEAKEIYSGQLDAAPDVFNYNFGSYSGQFVFEDDLETPYYLKKQRNWNVDWNNESITIIVENGTKYIFDETETSSIEIDGGTVLENEVVTAWHLSKIISTKEEEIDFEYTTVNNFHYPQRKTNSLILNHSKQNSQFVPQPETIVQFNVKRIATISLSKKGRLVEKVVFSNLTLRKDIIGTGYALSSIEIFDDKLQKQKGFEIEIQNTNNERLFLTKIQEISGDGAMRHTPYQFKYILPEDLPERLEYKSDHWGYYSAEGTEFPYSEAYPWRQAKTKATTIEATYGTLSHVYYPTGGYAKYNYELNQYVSEGQTKTNGGFRIASQELYDKKNKLLRRMEYNYNIHDENGNISSNSSGLITEAPYLLMDYKKLISPNLLPYRFLELKQLKSVPSNIHFSRVYYAQVAEYSSGNGFTLHHFHTTDSGETGYRMWLETVLDPVIWDNGLQIPQPFGYTTRWPYTGNYLLPSLLHEPERIAVYQIKDGKPFLSKSIQYNYEKFYNELYKTAPYMAYNMSATGRESILFGITALEREYFKLKNTIETQYTSDGNTLKKTTEYNYQIPHYHFPTQITIKNDSINPLTTIKKFPYAMVKERKDPNGHYQKLLDQHSINTVVSIEKAMKIQNTEKPISTQKTVYKEENGFVVPHKIQTAKGGSALEDRHIFDRYDRYGNVVEQHTAGGALHTVILWGYNRQYPIARIDNATYLEVQTALGLGSAEPNESHLPRIDALRNSQKNWQITTYAHQPLVGVTKITAPNGISTHYEYDDFSRLKTVRDKDLKRLEEYHYHYAQ